MRWRKRLLQIFQEVDESFLQDVQVSFYMLVKFRNESTVSKQSEDVTQLR